MVKDVDEHYENSYLATLFKNQNKCRDITDRLLGGLHAPDKQGGGKCAERRATGKTLFE